MADAVPGTGLSRANGQILTGWPHVLQCLEVIFATRFGERVLREWFGSMVPAMLGENLTAATILRTKLAMWVAIEAWEPRYRVTRLTSLEVNRQGQYRIDIEGEYRPRAHLGDRSIEGPRRVALGSRSPAA